MSRSKYILELKEESYERNEKTWVRLWWWVLKSGGNYQTLSTSEMYTTKNNALKTMAKLAKSIKGKVKIKGGK